MQKKYLPYLVLLAAAFLLWYVKGHQRGSDVKNRFNVDVPVENIEEFNRKASVITYSKHALCRMDCRHIDASEIKEILENGQLNRNKIEEDERGKTYPLEGITHDQQHVRVVFAPKGNDELVVVTCIDLDTDWSCDCK